MRECKNHEGYYDPTASEAIRRNRRYKFRKKEVKQNALTYRLGEVKGFIDAAKGMRLKHG